MTPSSASQPPFSQNENHAAIAYAELQTITNFSFLRGGSHPAELVEQAKALGHRAIGVADRNTLAGVVRAHAAAKKVGLKLLVGSRLDTLEGLSLVCYPKDRAAYGRLCRLLTRGKRRAEKGDCHITLDDVLEFAEGQIFILLPPEITPPPDPAPLKDRLGLEVDGPGRHPPLCDQKGRPTKGFETALLNLKASACDGLWLAANHLYHGDDRRRLIRLSGFAARFGVPLIATNDVHYHVPERRQLQDVVTCIREKCTIETAGFRLAANAERHLKPPHEMARLFSPYPEALEATRTIADRVTFNLDELAYNYPNEPVPPGKTPQEHLSDLAWKGADHFYPDGVPKKVKTALVKELALIDELNYAPYFLTVHDIVAYARKEGILCQGRGSAANSSVCYCLGVTAVDPTATDLLFERFLSRARKEPPDIDVDFEHERREEVIQYVYERYGRDRASLTATIITYRPRSAVREVGKVMGLTEDITSALASTVWGSWGSELPEKQVKEAGLDLSDPLLARTIKLTHELLGFPRHLSQHVGGFVLTEDRLEEMIPIGNAAMDERTFIEWDKDDIDELKILKVDVLGLGMLSCIAKCFSFLEKQYNRPVSLDSMPKEDERVYHMLQRADAVGVFQVESRAQLNMLPRLKPKNFYDLVIEVAIVRPGPIQGDMVHPYLRRRDGIETVHYPSPSPDHGSSDELEKVLGRTLGVPLFQEQAMQIAIDAAKFTPDEANELRRAMATFRRMGTIHTLEEKMVSRMIARGYDPDFARRCFDQIKGFGEYGFPESHAASFALLVYASSWLKCHYPEVFCAGLLNAQPMGFYAPAQIVRDAREHNVEVRPVDVNFSHWDNTLEPVKPVPDHLPEFTETSTPWGKTGGGLSMEHGNTHAVRLGFRQVDGLKKEQMEAFVKARDAERQRLDLPEDRPVFDTLDIIRRRTGLSISVLERLAATDAFRSLGLDRRQALWAVRGLVSDVELPLFAAADERATGSDHEVTLPDMRLSEHVVADYQTHRLSLKAHPMSFLRAGYDQKRISTCKNLDNLRNNQWVSVAGVVLVRQKPGTAKGVVFMTIEDETGIANIIVWNKVMQRYRKVVMGARLVRIRGVVQRTKEIIHVIARELTDLTGDLDYLSDDEMPAPLARADEVLRPVPERKGPPTRSSSRSGHSDDRRPSDSAEKFVKRPEPALEPGQVELFQHRPANENSGRFLKRKRPSVTPAQAVPRPVPPEVNPRRGETAPARGTHPRNVRIIPKSRDFH
ncbi:MAG: error-prone DNA polymerase [Pseudomonadota bacterium]